MPTSFYIVDTPFEIWNSDTNYESESIGCKPDAKSKRILFTNQQISVLEDYFNKNEYPSVYEMMVLSNELDVGRSKIKVWFQNRRMKVKREGKPSKSMLAKRLSGRYGNFDEFVLDKQVLKHSTPDEKTKSAIDQKVPPTQISSINPLLAAPDVLTKYETVDISQYSLDMPQKTTLGSTQGPSDVGSSYNVPQHYEVTQMTPWSNFQIIQASPDKLVLDPEDSSDPVSHALLIADIFARNICFTEDH